jgi:tRNA(fMet)-specific endonuclease VapC
MVLDIRRPPASSDEYRSHRAAKNLARVDALQFEVVDLDHEDARRAAEIRAALASMGNPISPTTC